ncbi:MAG TPA: dTDP-4-dehydrorhamnose reductase [Fibrobacteres bacterium]|jgi:dTDP-4-dehydrorhamnose reductase|nr:dTDP-4-dehydrorhamnose reductase [Fibrobacterota bacterium]
MKILIIGCNGQLGKDMVKILLKAGHDVHGIDYPDIDISSSTATDTIIKNNNPDVIINCAAFTAVDECEKKHDIAYAVNRDGIANIAGSAKNIGARVIHFSTDYVFNGNKNMPYTEDDQPDPQSVYGKSKLEGDKKLAAILPDHVILRVAWLYGIHGRHFIKKITKRAMSIQGAGQILKVVTDEIGTPTYSIDVCRQTLALLTKDATGVFHCTNEGWCSRYEFATEIIRAYSLDVSIQPCTSAEFKLPAPRPAYSVLENKRLKDIGMNVMRDWKVAFNDYITEEKNTGAT